MPPIYLFGLAMYIAWNFILYGPILATPNNLLVLLGGGAIALGFTLSGLLLFYFFGLPALARREYARAPYLGSTTRYRFEVDRLRTQSAFGSDILPYDMLGRTLIGKDMILLSKGANAVFTIPRDQLSADQEAALLDLLIARDLLKGPRS